MGPLPIAIRPLSLAAGFRLVSHYWRHHVFLHCSAGIGTHSRHGPLPDTTPLNLPSSDYLVPYLIDTLADKFPWFLGLLAVCALAAMQSTGAAYMSTASGIITRDLYRHFLNREASQAAQVAVGRVTVGVVVSLALLVGLARRLTVLLAAWPCPMASKCGLLCWASVFCDNGERRLGRRNLTSLSPKYGVGGLIGGGPLSAFATCAGWGIFFNLLVTILISALTREEAETQPTARFHDFLRDHTVLSPEKRKW